MINKQHTKEFNELKLTDKQKEKFADRLLGDYRYYLEDTVLKDENFDLTMTEDFQTWEEMEIERLRENVKGSFEEWLIKEYIDIV